MPFELPWRPEVLKKHQEFFNDSAYKDYLENAVSFNRKLNEERKMRLPYIDGQTGVAQRHYNGMRNRRERMPPPDNNVDPGKIICYPQKHWHKKRYQYLKYFMAPKHRFDPEADMHTISQVENPSAAGGPPPGGPGAGGPPLPGGGGPPGSGIPMNEDSNHSAGAGSGSGGGLKEEGGASRDGWSYYDEDMYGDGDMMGDEPDSGSDFDEDFSYGSRNKGRKGDKDKEGGGRRGGKKGGGGKRGSKGGEGGTGGSIGGNKRRSHADAIPDSEKPFACDRFGGNRGGGGNSRRSTAVNYSEDMDDSPLARSGGSPAKAKQQNTESGGGSGATPGGKPPFKKSELCDFCLGDKDNNVKTGKAEELVSCSDCGRSGHPTCLQFTDNMIISVKKYPWQCIECKCCSICGKSEDDDQLLFCDDCDRGYHMYCLSPPLKEPPEGSWSCHLCMEIFHKK